MLTGELIVDEPDSCLVSAVNLYFGVHVFESTEGMYAEQRTYFLQYRRWRRTALPCQLEWVSSLRVGRHHYRLVLLWSSRRVPYRACLGGGRWRGRTFLFHYTWEGVPHIEAVRRDGTTWVVLSREGDPMCVSLLPGARRSVASWLDCLDRRRARADIDSLAVYRFLRINRPC
jgi:hypothetical protein